MDTDNNTQTWQTRWGEPAKAELPEISTRFAATLGGDFFYSQFRVAVEKAYGKFTRTTSKHFLHDALVAWFNANSSSKTPLSKLEVAEVEGCVPAVGQDGKQARLVVDVGDALKGAKVTRIVYAKTGQLDAGKALAARAAIMEHMDRAYRGELSRAPELDFPVAKREAQVTLF